MESEIKHKNKKSPVMNMLRKILVDVLRRIDDGECSDGEIYGTLNRFNAESKGFYNDESFVNYDEAMRITGIRNRNKFRDTCRLNCIEQKKINNMKVGFLRSEIEDLAYRIQHDECIVG